MGTLVEQIARPTASSAAVRPAPLLATVGLVLFYALAHGLLLIDRGIFWDDWTLLDVPSEVVMQNHIDAGSYFFGRLHVALIEMPQAIMVYNLLTFCCYLISGLLLWRILRRSGLLTNSEAWGVSALALVLPLNLARNAMINGQYAVCYALFFAAFAVFQANEQRIQRSGPLTIVTVVLFTCSFLTNSLLVFFILAPVYAVWNRRPATRNELISTARQIAPWLLLPVVFWIARSLFFVPSGRYATTHYNEITLSNLLHMPLEMVRTLYFSFGKVLIVSILSLRSALPALLAVLGGASILLVCRREWLMRPEQTILRPRALRGILGGALLFMLGAFPYLAAGCFPTLSEWSSRHQLLLPLGSALMLFFGVKLIISWFPQRFTAGAHALALGGLLIVSISYDLQTYLSYERDWLKQESLLRQFRQSPVVANGHTLLLDDQTRELNVFERAVRFYEYTGQLKQVFGTETRLLITATDLKGLQESGLLQSLVGSHTMHLSDYHMSVPDGKLTILPGVHFSDLEVLVRTASGHIQDSPQVPVVRLVAQSLRP